MLGYGFYISPIGSFFLPVLPLYIKLQCLHLCTVRKHNREGFGLCITMVCFHIHILMYIVDWNEGN